MLLLLMRANNGYKRCMLNEQGIQALEYVSAELERVWEEGKQDRRGFSELSEALS